MPANGWHPGRIALNQDSHRPEWVNNVNNVNKVNNVSKWPESTFTGAQSSLAIDQETGRIINFCGQESLFPRNWRRARARAGPFGQRLRERTARRRA